MAEGELEYLLTNLQQLQQEEQLDHRVKDGIEKLENNLHLFRAFLSDSTKKRLNHSREQAVVSQIHNVVYKAQDVIGVFGAQGLKLKSARFLFQGIRRRMKFNGIATKIQSISGEVRAIYTDQNVLDLANLNIIGDGDPDESVSETIRQDNLVGLEDQAEEIIGYVMEEREKLDVINIIGMAGLGKTTMAMKIFRSMEIQNHFAIRFWVSIPHKFNLRAVLLQILTKVTTQDMSGNTDEDLSQAVRAYLEGRHFFLVIDGVWTVKDLNYIRKFLPKGNSRGKVLITSRDLNVGIHANPTRKPLNLHFLTSDESWQLLQYQVSEQLGSFPAKLEEIGHRSAMECDGVPLLVVTTGGVLVERFSKAREMSAMKRFLTRMSRNLKDVGTTLKMSKARSDAIALSFDKLPEELRTCFLYLGVFPQDWEISAWILTRLWIAEGFIQHKVGKSLEEIAQDNLNNLINRNLVFATRTNMSGEVRTCRVHSVIRESLHSKVRNMEPNLFKEIKMLENGDFDPPVFDTKNYHRVCIHSNLSKFLSEEELKGYGVRSLLCFSKESYVRHVTAIPDKFKLLRVLESNSFKFRHFPRNIDKVIHLRYITLSIDNLDVLPDTVSKLWNLQTLLINTTSQTLEIRANLWKLKQLRHLKTKAAILLAVQGKGDQACENLQTLARVLPEYCTKEVFNRARNLKRLGIRGRLATLFEGNYSLDELDQLENLKMVNDLLSASESPLLALPPAKFFPVGLKRLSLSATYLAWSQMSTLGRINSLEVLKLKDNAFTGPSWDADGHGFHALQSLLITNSDLVFWNASDKDFPSLRCLVLRNCEKLSEIPVRMEKILQKLSVDSVGNSAVKCAKEIEEEKEVMMHEQQQARRGIFKFIRQT